MIPFLFIPVIAWIVAGCTKFAVNFLRFGKSAFSLIGNGGFPSTHSTVVGSAFFFAVLKEGVDSTAAVTSLALLLIVIIDAMGLRRTVGRHATTLNEQLLLPQGKKILRERQGHEPFEVAGGLLLGFVVAWTAGGFWR